MSTNWFKIEDIGLIQEEIINGEMREHIHNNLQKHKVCIETCGTYEGDKQLGEIFL